MKKYFVGCYNKSVILTYLGVGFSVFGMLYLTNTIQLESINRFDVSMICLIVAGICDLFDGFIARKCNRNEQEKLFGVQIDSLADVISFLIFPVILLNRFNQNLYGENIVMYLLAIFYILCGVIRLAWFNSNVGETVNRYYQGLPVTYISLILPIYYAFSKIVRLDCFGIGLNIIFVIVAILFILNVKIRKPGGIWYAFFSVLAIGTSVVIIYM